MTFCVRTIPAYSSLDSSSEAEFESTRPRYHLMNRGPSAPLAGWPHRALPKFFGSLMLVGSQLAGAPLEAQSNAEANAPNLGPLARQKFVRTTGDALGYELRPS